MACLPNSFQIHLRKRCQIWRLLTAQILLKLYAFKAGEAAPGLNRVTQFQTSPRQWADLVTDLMDLSRTFFLLPESEKKEFSSIPNFSLRTKNIADDRNQTHGNIHDYKSFCSTLFCLNRCSELKERCKVFVAKKDEELKKMKTRYVHVV